MSPIKPRMAAISPNKKPFFAPGTALDDLKYQIAPMVINRFTDIIAVSHIVSGMFAGSVISRSVSNNLDKIAVNIIDTIPNKIIIPIARLIFILYFDYSLIFLSYQKIPFLDRQKILT